MKLLKNEKMTQKIIIMLLVILSFNFIFSSYSQAKVDDVLVKPIRTFVLWLGDGVLQLLQENLMGEEAIIEGYSDYRRRINEDNVDNAQSIPEAVLAGLGNAFGKLPFGKSIQGWIDGEINGSDGYTGPVVLVKYSVPAIVSNKIPAFDVDFFNPMETEEGKPKSTAYVLKRVVQKWYVILRDIALVVLLSTLVYIGIKIILSSSSEDKAKYKTKIINWITALVLLFTLQYIMAITLYIADIVTDALTPDSSSYAGNYESSSSSDLVNGSVYTYNGEGYDAYLSVIRTLAEMSETSKYQLGYTLMYAALIVIIIMFSFVYLKRTIYIAFLTMIAPLIAVTYPLDKEKDGKSQAFDFWLKEYMFNIIMQIVHLLIYFMFIGSAIDLAQENIIYGIIAMGMIIPSEKIIRKMFNLEKAGSDSALSSSGFFEGALTASALNKLSSMGKGSKGGNSNQDKLGDGTDKSDTSVRSADPFEVGEVNNRLGSENNSDGIDFSDSNVGNDTGDENSSDYDFDLNPGITGGNNNPSNNGLDLDPFKDVKPNSTSENNASGVDSSANNDSTVDKSTETKKKQIKGFKKLARGLGAVGKKYYKPIGMGALKIAGLGMGAAVGGTIGLASTIATGNINNLGKFTGGGMAAGAGAVHLATNGAMALGKNVKRAATDVSDTYRIGANNMTEKEYQDKVLIPRLKKSNDKNSEIKSKYEREFGDTKLMKSSTRDEMYKAGIIDESMIIKALKEKQKSNISDTELVRDAILASGVKNYKDMESVEKRIIKNLEGKGVFDKLVEKMEKEGKFKTLDKKLESKYQKIEKDNKLNAKEKKEEKLKIRKIEVNKMIEKEKSKVVEKEVKRIEKLSGI